jgi:hypothetical protein
MPWVLEVSDFGSLTYADWLKDTADIRIIDVQPFQETDRERFAPPVALARYLCHLLIDRLPDRAVPELCESMARMFDFYRDLPAQLPPPALQGLAVPRRARPTRPTTPRERPAFNIGDEQ